MRNLRIPKHPLISDSLTHLRNRETSVHQFRHHSDKLCNLLLIESLKDIQLQEENVTTPIGKTPGFYIKEEIVVIPVLRAGIAMLSAAMQLLPKAKIGFVGLERDEKTAVASRYYWKLPPISKNTYVLITDPMLATGGSLLHILREIVPKHPKSISVISVITAPEGIGLIEKEFPNVVIYTASLDERLNGKKYIVPGLGDYGDRYFGTE